MMYSTLHQSPCTDIITSDVLLMLIRLSCDRRFKLSILPILELPHPALRQKARTVKKIDDSIVDLAYNMIDTMRNAGGVGLAANQVGVLRRVIVVQIPHDEIDETQIEDQELNMASIYINPEIVHREGEREVEEGCLSIPGYKGVITRSIWVKFRALDHKSKLVKLKADGLLSQIIEHEVDHLNGILYVDHLSSHEKLIKVESEVESDLLHDTNDIEIDSIKSYDYMTDNSRKLSMHQLHHEPTSYSISD